MTEKSARNLYIFASVRPDLLPLQIEAFRAHLREPHRIHVVVDQRDRTHLDEFRQLADRYGTGFSVFVGQPSFDGSMNHGEVLNAVYRSIAEDDTGISVFLDHDMFPVKPFSFEDLLGPHEVLGSQQIRGSIRYLWPGLLLFRRKALAKIPLDFLPGIVGNQRVDTAGGTHVLFDPANNINVGIYTLRDLGSFNGQQLPSNIDYDFGFELHLNDTFLHCRNSSGWHRGFNTEADNRNGLLLQMLDHPELFA